VMLLDLHPAKAIQEGLFDKRDSARRVTLMRTIDKLNARFGRDTLTFAAVGHRQPWRMQRDRLSPCYTTDWQGLLRV
jgi:DNA polymerase V